MIFNILVGSSLFVNEEVDRSILSFIQGKDIVLVGNGNTLLTKSFRIQDDLIRKLETSGAKKVIYTELTSRNMAILKHTDLIYIMAGDVKELLHLYQNSLFKVFIEKHLKKGILLAEGEAAILLAKDVTWYLNECRLTRETSKLGLGILQENFYMHYQYEDLKLEEKIKKMEKKYKIEFKRLTDQDCYFTSSIIQ